MAKTLRKRKIAKAYGLNFKSRTLPSGLKLNVIKRKIGKFLVGCEFYTNSTSNMENEIRFYGCILKLQSKIYIGGK